MVFLAGDIGGTKTNLAVFSPETGPRASLAEATFPSADYPSLEALALEFLSQVNLKVERASFGVAGPVAAGRAEITNLPWVMDETQLQEALNLSSVRLLNDLASIAHAVPFLELDDLHTLNEGQPAPGGAIAIVAPGTGLGEAYLTWDGSRYRPHASEGGHTDFAPNNPLEVELLRYLQDRFEHVSYERVCSGRGLPNIYAHLKDSGYAEEPAWLAEQLAEADDPTPVIVNAALDKERPCELRHAQHLRLHPKGRGRKPSSQGVGQRRRLSGWRHPAAHPACPGGRAVHGGFPAQGAHVGPADAYASARHPQPQDRSRRGSLPQARSVARLCND